MPQSPHPSFWETVSLPENGTLKWVVGPLSLWVRRHSVGCVVASHRTPMTSRDPWPERSLFEPNATDSPPEEAETTRIASSAVDRVGLGARLADRATVVRLSEPLHCRPGARIRLFVATPLWVGVALQGQGEPIAETPTRALTGTWFGTPKEGELCYASVSTAPERLPSPERSVANALCPVELHNSAATEVVMDRIRLPMPLLSLYRDQDGHHWTQSMTLRRIDGLHDGAELVIGNGPPAEAVGSRLVSDPRVQDDVRVWEKAIRLFVPRIVLG